MYKKHFFVKKENNILILNIEKNIRWLQEIFQDVKIGARTPIRIKRLDIFGGFQYHSE